MKSEHAPRRFFEVKIVYFDSNGNWTDEECLGMDFTDVGSKFQAPANAYTRPRPDMNEVRKAVTEYAVKREPGPAAVWVKVESGIPFLLFGSHSA